MRIRSIKPEFWTSEDVAALDWDTRLIFIGLWSYVDDNGVGRDVEKLIVADLFPLEDDPRDTLARVSRALQRLAQGGQITRYTAGGKPYLHVTAWDRHQKIDHPAKNPRYPDPTRADAPPDPDPRDTLASPREGVAPGEGEKGRRGEGEKTPALTTAATVAEGAALVLVTADAVTVSEPTFEDFWAAYPKKRDRADALKAWPKAIKKVPASVIVEAAKRLRDDPNLPELTYVPNGATWLNGEKWNNPPYESRHGTQANARPSTTDARVQAALDAGAEVQAMFDARRDGAA
jgi:hypothetical protein